MSSKKPKPLTEPVPTQGTLFGADPPPDAYRERPAQAPAAGRPRPDSPCGGCGHPLGRHTAQGEGLCLDCDCGGWSPPRPRAWDEGLTPPTPGELAALHAAHPGVLLLFRHPHGCAFHGHDAGAVAGLLGLPLSDPGGAPRFGWAHGDFDGPVRKLLRAGRAVAVVERGEGLPPGHRLGAEPVVTPWTVVPEGEDTHDA